MLIGMCGAAGSGKDTAASAIIEHYGYDKESFAWGLKNVLCFIFGWPMAKWEDNGWKEAPNDRAYGLSPRQLAQTLGTDWGRNTVSENIWVDALIRRIQKDDAFLDQKFIFTDVRFPNEAKAIRSQGGIVIYVTCSDRETSTDHSGHESERWLPWLHLFADVEITAQFGQIDELREAALNVVANYMHENVPRFVPSQETLQQLRSLEELIGHSLLQRGVI